MAVNDMRVGITLGDGADFITQGDEIHVIKRARRGDAISRINLGRATKKRLEDLQAHLSRLSIHAVDA